MALGGILGDLAAKPLPFAATVLVGGLSLLLIRLFFSFRGGVTANQKTGSSQIPPPPAVPGLPIVGNLLQLKEKKPHKTFAKWAETYGPIYSIRAGADTIVVLNSTDVAKEAMVTRYSSISTRKLSKALQILTADKCMVATSDYNDFHKNIKRHILTGVLGANAQKRFRCHRDTMVENVAGKLHAHVSRSPLEAVNFRAVFKDELFGLACKEAIGVEVQPIYVKELGTTLSKKDIFKVLVSDFMAGAIEVDWRDFFPYLKWVPNNNWENKIHQIAFRRKVLMKALIEEQKKRISSGKEINCYLDYLISQVPALTDDQIAILVWEVIIEASDTTLVTTEWALYELAKVPQLQNRLYQEMQKVCGSERITEEQIYQLPYLGAVFHETLRKHSPVPLVPLRYAHEDTQLGGYFIRAGSQIAINVYGCNVDKKQWENPEEWIPERFLGEKYDPTDLYKTMAFGAGKRVCAGSLQALLISCTMIGRMVQEFEWKLKGDEKDNYDTAQLTTHKLHPMQAILRPRQQ